MAKRNQMYNEWGKAYRAFSKAILESGKALNQIATVELQEVADDFLKETDAQWPHSTRVGKKRFGGDRLHPWYSGQLHDSVAVRIAQGNRTVSVHYMPPSPDTGKPQHTEQIKHIVGVEWAHEVAERRAPYYFLPGVQVQLIVGVPYSDKVNESSRHHGFADSLADDLFSNVNEWILDGGLTRDRLIADEKGARIVKQTNVRRLNRK
ncbi:MAG: hypothetical protein J6T35_02540 [Bacteroidales bacterium]|nr:hypothetical protein [Bacteroidales bacterium]